MMRTARKGQSSLPRKYFSGPGCYSVFCFLFCIGLAPFGSGRGFAVLAARSLTSEYFASAFTPFGSPVGQAPWPAADPLVGLFGTGPPHLWSRLIECTLKYNDARG